MSVYQAIIVGAGVSALTAASELAQNGITNILILEAQNRIGGRTYTVPAEDHKNVIEYGAQWVHGEKGNPVYELCSKIGIIDKQTKTDFGEAMLYATQDGYEIDSDEVDEIYEYIEKFYDDTEDIAEGLDENEDQSLITILDKKFSKSIKKLVSKSKLPGDKVSIIKAIFNSRLMVETIDTACENLNELSAIGWNEYEDCDGDTYANLKHGYEQLIQYLSSKIPQDRIMINQIVTKIRWNDYDNNNDDSSSGSMVTVTTYNPETKQESVYQAQQCLCTMSLGCLKATYKYLFEPRLPNSKINAIERLGFGLVNKVFLAFEEPFLRPNVQGLQILWKDDVDFKLETVKKWNIQNETFYKSFIAFEVHPFMPNVLYTFISGENAKFIETLENNVLAEIIYEMLSKCFNKLSIPKPKYLIKYINQSAWNSNEFVRGSYSYIKMNSSVNDIKTLAQPLSSKLHFSGEATDPKFYSTVHGAYRSGLRAAKCILKILEK